MSNVDIDILIEATLILLVLNLDNEEELAQYYMEKVITYLNIANQCIPEHIIISYTLLGFLNEQRNNLKSQHSYHMSIILSHNHYGDPRG